MKIMYINTFSRQENGEDNNRRMKICKSFVYANFTVSQTYFNRQSKYVDWYWWSFTRLICGANFLFTSKYMCSIQLSQWFLLPKIYYNVLHTDNTWYNISTIHRTNYNQYKLRSNYGFGADKSHIAEIWSPIKQ